MKCCLKQKLATKHRPISKEGFIRRMAYEYWVIMRCCPKSKGSFSTGPLRQRRLPPRYSGNQSRSKAVRIKLAMGASSSAINILFTSFTPWKQFASEFHHFLHRVVCHYSAVPADLPGAGPKSALRAGFATVFVGNSEYFFLVLASMPS